MKNCFKILLACIIGFSILSFTLNNNNIQAATKKTVKGAVIKSHYGACSTQCFSSTVVDLYMKPKEARIYASKSEASVKEGLAWLGASFIPGAGPYLSVIGFISTTQRSELSSNIRKYTNKDQSVHITIMKDEKYKFSTYVVKKWDGQKSSIKPFKAPAPQYLKVLYKKYKY